VNLIEQPSLVRLGCVRNLNIGATRPRSSGRSWPPRLLAGVFDFSYG
jgi:hypothetical protein